MVDDCGKATGNKIAEALVQLDSSGEEQQSLSQNFGDTLSGRVWSGEINQVAKFSKKMESSPSANDLQLHGGDLTPPGAIGNEKDVEMYKKFKSLGEKHGSYFEQREQTSDCGWGRVLDNNRNLAEFEESMRRLSKIDLRKYSWNATDPRR